MRWFTERHLVQRWFLRALAMLLVGAAYLAIAGCGSPPMPQLPGGTFSNATFGFRVNYPQKWQANASPATPGADTATTAIPFSVVITRTGASHSAAALISTCTITVMNLKNSDIARSAASLPSNKALQQVTIGGVRGYKSSPLVQNIPNTQISVTHVDYYVLHGNYEYQLSTDSVKGDDAEADLQSIIASFAFGS